MIKSHFMFPLVEREVLAAFDGSASFGYRSTLRKRRYLIDVFHQLRSCFVLNVLR